MADTSSDRIYIIQGRTKDGRVFRPSDWAERLAGVMASFRPGSDSGPVRQHGYLCYSPWCTPTLHDGVRSVQVNAQLRAHDVRAWDFVMDFARSNDLPVIELEQNAQT